VFWDARTDCDTVYCMGTAVINGKMEKQIFTKKFNGAFLWGENMGGCLFDTAVTDGVKYCWMGERCVRNWAFCNSYYPILCGMTRKNNTRNLSPHIGHWPWYKGPFWTQTSASLILFMFTQPMSLSYLLMLSLCLMLVFQVAIFKPIPKTKFFIFCNFHMT
jgi:hypothetical protein